MLGVLAVATACTVSPTFQTGYEPPAAIHRTDPLRGALAVKPFLDERPPRYYSSPHRQWMLYIPFLPYVSLEYERVDETVDRISDRIERLNEAAAERPPPPKGPSKRRRHTGSVAAGEPIAPPLDAYAYPSSFAEAVAEDLAASGLFEEVNFRSDGEATGERWLLEGRLRESRLQIWITSYGLGYWGTAFWYLAIPAAKKEARTVLDLQLTDRERGEVVWEHQLQGRVTRLFTAYSPTLTYGPRTGFEYGMFLAPRDAGVPQSSLFSWNFAALRDGMAAAREDLASTLAGLSPATPAP